MKTGPVSRLAHRLLFACGALGAVAAAAACEIYVPDPNAPRQTAQPAPPVAAQPAAGPATPDPPRNGTTMALRDDEAAPATPNHVTEPIPPGGGCWDTGAAQAVDCANVAVSSSCPNAPAQQRCNVAKSYFTPKVAAATVACLDTLSPGQTCDPRITSACEETALKHACILGSVLQVCKVAATNCRTTVNACYPILSGLNQDGQTAVAECVAQGCTGGLAGCIEALGSPTASAR